ncbi:hypothetical protein GBA52_012934 [Prunus armeniaca]|nr:hypothetical protein GBA52_012934 [Prunus armeniaca]
MMRFVEGSGGYRFISVSKEQLTRFFRGRDASSDSSPQSPSFPPSPSSRSSAPVTGPPRPIRLVYCDDIGKFIHDSHTMFIIGARMEN